MSAALQVLVVLGVLAVVHVPLGDHLARTYSGGRHSRLERAIYRSARVDPEADQRWPVYLACLLAFSSVGIGVLYLLLRLQGQLPLSLGHPGMSPALAFDTAVSFTTNTSWQSYAGESTLGHFALMAGLGTQAFLSMAVGVAAAVALIRGLARTGTDRVGNVWVDITRTCTRVVLPLTLVGAIVLLALGVVQSLGDTHTYTTLVGGSQSIVRGPVASWEPLKLLTGDGGGAFNSNSAQPLENPSPVSNVIEIVFMLLIPSAFPRAYGHMVGDRRQGWALAGVVAVLLTASMGAGLAASSGRQGTVGNAVGGQVEGSETRVGVAGTTVFGVAATASADGAADGSYDSLSSLGGGVLMANMMLNEVSPGGSGSGIYSLLMLAMLAVFLGGLMIGRTPEYLGKRVQRREITLVALYSLSMPAVLLVATAVAVALPAGRAGFGNAGAHGLSEGLYAVTSAVNGNGSAFAGLNANTTFWNSLLGVVMLLGRYVPMVFVLALAGAFARQGRRPAGLGTLPTHTPFFAALLTAVAVVVGLLSFLPVLALAPLADALG